MRYLHLVDPIASIRVCQSNPLWRAHVLDIADRSLSNTFIFTEKYEMERCTVPVSFDEIDWDAVPFGDEEWCFAFNRHTFLLNNAKAAAITGDRRYLDNWIRLFEDFFTRSHLSENTKKRSWRSLECGIRIENYLRSLELLSASKMEIDGKTMDDISTFLSVHVDYLMETHTDFHRLSNWGILQDHGLFLASLHLGRQDGMQEALRRLDEELRLQVLPDGMHWEQSSMYHAEVLHAALDTIIVADRAGIEVPEGMRRRTHELALALARTLRPDGKCYLFGDSDEIDMRDIVAAAAVIFADGELSYYAQGGLDEEFWLSFAPGTELPKPTRPEGSRLRFMKESGNAIIEMSDDAAIRFHCGLLGSGHGHLDQLHFDLYCGSGTILTDAGRYTYTDTPERYALKGAYGHNTIVIDGCEPSLMEDSWSVSSFAEPLFCDAAMKDGYGLLRGSHLGYASKGIIITRTIATISDSFVVIADDISAPGRAQAEILFHFDTETVLDLEDGDLVATSNGTGIRMFLPEEAEARISKAHISKRYNELLETPLLTLSCGIEERGCIVTVISLKKGGMCRRSPVTKPLTGAQVPSRISAGLILSDGCDEYSMGIVTNEHPAGGFLLKAGKAEAFGRIFISRNGGEATVLRS